MFPDRLLGFIALSNTAANILRKLGAVRLLRIVPLEQGSRVLMALSLSAGTSPFRQLSDAARTRFMNLSCMTPNLTFSAIRRTVELVGERSSLERGLIEAVITG